MIQLQKHRRWLDLLPSIFEDEDGRMWEEEVVDDLSGRGPDQCCLCGCDVYLGYRCGDNVVCSAHVEVVRGIL